MPQSTATLPATREEYGETISATLHLLDVLSPGLEVVITTDADATHYAVARAGLVYTVNYSDDDTLSLRMRRHQGMHDIRREDFVVSALSRYDLSRLLCEFILGKPHIPAPSRKFVRDGINVARKNAQYIFRIGMNHLMSEDLTALPHWLDLDESERWERIVQAASDAGVGPSEWMWYYRNARVAFQMFDIYDDVYIEQASDLIATVSA